jgi:EAL domain-containing protein (putative c-di-GMP-specific phosphodiesterase class I)
VLEITEHAVVADYEATIAAVQRVRDLGVRIAVDDAGSGISSFQHVLRLEPEIVKLDRWIIDHLDEDPARQALVRFLVAFADELGIQLVAEGIERREERQACHAIGVTHGQGYLIGRPSPLSPPPAHTRA